MRKPDCEMEPPMPRWFYICVTLFFSAYSVVVGSFLIWAMLDEWSRR